MLPSLIISIIIYFTYEYIGYFYSSSVCHCLKEKGKRNKRRDKGKMTDKKGTWKENSHV
jgi:hypothetical protein